MSEAIVMGAVLDATGIYRYSLTRRWGSPAEPRVLFVMLNPSTADAEQDDPTIRKCIAYATAWGYGSLEVVNLFAFRSTDPSGLLRAADPVGPDNDSFIRSAAAYARKAVFAHGTSGNRTIRERIRGRSHTVRSLVRERGHDLVCLGLTQDRQPRHPLYLKSNLQPMPLETA